MIMVLYLQVSNLHHVVSQATSEYCNVSAATESVPVAPVNHQNTPVRNIENIDSYFL